MKVFPVPVAERERLKALNEYHILDTPPEAEFDFLTSLAAKTCETPVALLSFFDSDRQWFKSCFGVDIRETSKGLSLCSLVANTPDEVMVIDDVRSDERFHDRIFEQDGQQVIFYAGVALKTPGGQVPGVLCLFDTEPNSLSDEKKGMLKAIAEQVVSLLELRKTTLLLQKKEADLSMAYSDLSNIAYIASHDLKSPINNIISLAHIISEEYSTVMGEEGAEYINFIYEAAYYLSDMVSGIHSYSKASKLAVTDRQRVHIESVIDEVIAALKVPGQAQFSKQIHCKEMSLPLEATKLVLLHLLNNAIQYNDKDTNAIEITTDEGPSHYIFSIADNGEGIAIEDQERMFELFRRLRNRDKNGENMGNGLAIAKRLVGKMHGSISVQSSPGHGATFIFTIPKNGA